eukprot:4454063-Ditylum_brightwellii.AAC.1
MNASNEECSRKEGNDDDIHSQSISSNKLTTLEGNLTPTIMPLSIIDDETSDVVTQTGNGNALQMANITTVQSSCTLQKSSSSNVYHIPVTIREKLCTWFADIKEKKPTRKGNHDCAMVDISK